MSITFRYYKDEDFLKLEELVLKSYEWGNPAWQYSRHEFCRGVHVAWGNVKDNWRHTVGIWEEEGNIVSAIINEGCGTEMHFSFLIPWRDKEIKGFWKKCFITQKPICLALQRTIRIEPGSYTW